VRPVAVALELVDEQALDAAPAQIERKRQTHRSAADDENGGFEIHDEAIKIRRIEGGK
jgi:hypothetical protein